MKQGKKLVLVVLALVLVIGTLASGVYAADVTPSASYESNSVALESGDTAKVGDYTYTAGANGAFLTWGDTDGNGENDAWIATGHFSSITLGTGKAVDSVYAGDSIEIDSLDHAYLKFVNTYAGFVKLARYADVRVFGNPEGVMFDLPEGSDCNATHGSIPYTYHNYYTEDTSYYSECDDDFTWLYFDSSSNPVNCFVYREGDGYGIGIRNNSGHTVYTTNQTIVGSSYSTNFQTINAETVNDSNESVTVNTGVKFIDAATTYGAKSLTANNAIVFVRGNFKQVEAENNAKVYFVGKTVINNNTADGNGLNVSGNSTKVVFAFPGSSITSGHGHAVSVSGGAFICGADGAPVNLTSTSSAGDALHVTETGAVAKVYSANITSRQHHAIFVGEGGTVSVLGGDAFGENLNGAINIASPQTNDFATIMVDQYAHFEMRGRNVNVYRTNNTGAPVTDSQKTVLYIYDTGDHTNYPLSGGTFVGKIEAAYGDLSDLLLYNHYIRNDKNNFADKSYLSYSDGSRGVIAKGMTGDLDGAAEGYELVLTGINTVTDAEWELRMAMGISGEGYQIPQGIVRGLVGAYDYETNTVSGTADSSDCISLDINSKSSKIWGVEKALGDIEVIGSGHDLYLGGRSILYTAIATGTNDYEETTGETADTNHVFYIYSGAGLTVTDKLPSASEKQTLNVNDAETDPNAVLKMGGIYNTLTTTAYNCVFMSQGSLEIQSGKFQADEYGVYQFSRTSSPYSITASLLVKPDTEGVFDRIEIKALNGEGISSETGNVTVNGGRILGKNIGIHIEDGVLVDGSTLKVTDGYITSTAAGVGIEIDPDTYGVNYITGGYIVGKGVDALKEIAADNDYEVAVYPFGIGNGTSIVTGQELYIAMANDGHPVETTVTEEPLVTKTTRANFIGDVEVTDLGDLYIEKTAITNAPATAGNTLISGSLLVSCYDESRNVNARATIYSGEVSEDVTVTGYYYDHPTDNTKDKTGKAYLEVYGGLLATGAEVRLRVNGYADVDFYSAAGVSEVPEADLAAGAQKASNVKYGTVVGDVYIDGNAATTFNVGYNTTSSWTDYTAFFMKYFEVKGGTVEIVNATVNGRTTVSSSAAYYVYSGSFGPVEVTALDTESDSDLFTRVQLHGGKYESLEVKTADASTDGIDPLHQIGDIIPWRFFSSYTFDGITYASSQRVNHYVTTGEGESIVCLTDAQIDAETGKLEKVEVHNSPDELAAALKTNGKYTVHSNVVLDELISGVCNSHFYCGNDNTKSPMECTAKVELDLNGYDVIGKGAGVGIIRITTGDLTIKGGRIFNASSTGYGIVVTDGKLTQETGVVRGVKAGIEITGSGTYTGKGGWVASTWTLTGEVSGVDSPEPDTSWHTVGGLHVQDGKFSEGIGIEIATVSGKKAIVDLGGVCVYGSGYGIKMNGADDEAGIVTVAGGIIDAGTIKNVLFEADSAYMNSNIPAVSGGNGIDAAKGTVNLTSGTVSALKNGVKLSGSAKLNASEGIIVNAANNGHAAIDLSDSAVIVSITGGQFTGTDFGLYQNGGTITSITGGTFSAGSTGVGYNRASGVSNGSLGVDATSKKGAIFSSIVLESTEKLADLFTPDANGNRVLTFLGNGKAELGPVNLEAYSLKNSDAIAYDVLTTSGNLVKFAESSTLPANFQVVERTFYVIEVNGTSALGDLTISESSDDMYYNATDNANRVYVRVGATPTVSIATVSGKLLQNVEIPSAAVKSGLTASDLFRVGTSENVQSTDLVYPYATACDQTLLVTDSAKRTVTVTKIGNGTVSYKYQDDDKDYATGFQPEAVTMDFSGASDPSFDIADGNKYLLTMEGNGKYRLDEFKLDAAADSLEADVTTAAYGSTKATKDVTQKGFYNAAATADKSVGVKFLEIVPVTSVSLNQSSASLYLTGGDLSKTLTATVYPSNATEKGVTWTVLEGGSFITITPTDNTCVVEAVAVGTAKVQVETVEGGFKAVCNVTVAAEPPVAPPPSGGGGGSSTVSVSDVTVEQTALNLTEGESEELKTTVSPENATDPTVTYKSSDEKVATVDENGKVTAVGEGTATITVKAGNVTKTLTVTVKKAEAVSDDWYEDVPEKKWYYEPIKYCTDNKLFEGYEDNTFRPERTMSQGELATLLYRVANGEYNNQTRDWYVVPRDWALEKGVMTTYDRDSKVTRAAFIEMFYNTIKQTGKYDVTVKAADIEALKAATDYEAVIALPESTVKAIAWSVAHGLITGTANDDTVMLTVTPNSDIKRDEVATMLMRYYQGLK